MLVFWRHGYDGASYDKIVDATKASRKGLYSIWRDKETLYFDCLDLYEERVATPVFSELAAPDLSGADYDAFWDRSGVFTYNGAQLDGCFVCRAMFESTLDAPELSERCARHFDRLVRSFRMALRTVWAKEGAPEGADIEARARDAAALTVSLSAVTACGLDTPSAALRQLGQATRR